MADTGSGALAILFADIVGSTRLYDKFGNERAHAAVDGCLTMLKQVTKQFGGRTVKTIGDELMAAFPDAEAACVAATEMQWNIGDLPALDDTRISIRIGFHYGPAMERDGDLFGDSVNVAARVSALAKGEQIITTSQTLDAMSPQIAAGARHLWPIQVKGKAEPLDLFEIMWDTNSDATMTMSGQFLPPKIPVRLRLFYRDKEIAVGSQRPALSLGRDGVNEFVIDDPKASRVHARIEWRRDKFVLTDVSTNGTFVMNEEQAETCLRREEHILDGNGTIQLGHSHRVGQRNCVEFYCEYYVPGRSATMHAPERLNA